MPFFQSEVETLDPAAIGHLQRQKLARLLEEIRPSNAFYQQKLAGIQFDPLTDDLTKLPFTTREELQRDQEAHPPFGTNLTYELTRYNRYHQTSGTTGVPMRWLDTPESWEWFKRCWCIIDRAAGVVPTDRFVFPFSFGPFIGFWGAFEAAASLGNLCLPAGGMSTSARLRYLLDNGATVVCCTPTYALRMAETAQEEGLDLASSAVRLLIVAGEPGGSLPAVRSRIESDWGARVIDHVGMTEMGAYGFECLEARGGMHVIETEFIAEIANPLTGEPVPDGTRGELVLTNLGRWGSPLIRYRTGDVVDISRKRCACGRSFARLEGGILGRADDMLIVRGNNVFPTAVEAILRGFAEIAEFRLVVSTTGGMTELTIEVERGSDPVRSLSDVAFAEKITEAVRERLSFRAEVKCVPPGSLPRFEMKSHRVVRSKKP